MRGINKIIFLGVNLLFGLYFLNYALGVIKIDEIISQFDPWIIFVGGILIIFGAINYLRIKTYRALNR